MEGTRDSNVFGLRKRTHGSACEREAGFASDCIFTVAGV